MNIYICEDDRASMEHLLNYINSFVERYHIKNCEIKLFEDGRALLADGGHKDIVFLDIEMPDVNGIYIGQELMKEDKNTIIIIVTSYIEYLDEAMKFHVFRYLSKPVDKQRLFRNLKDAIQLYSNITATLPIETKDGVYTVLTSHIVYVEVITRKVIIHTIEGDYYSIQHIQYWLDKLPHGIFFQSHRSFIVNFAYVNNFDHSLIYLYNGQFTAYLTRRKYASFKNAYLLYLESR